MAKTSHREIEKVLKALGNRRRLTIIQHLKKHREMSVGEIAGSIELSFRSTSRHLAILHSAGIVEKEQKSLQMFYSITKKYPCLLKQILEIL